MEKHPLNIHTATAQQHALLIQYPGQSRNPPRRLLLLHGAGVAGEVTWTYLANYLTEWDEVLIPDFAGMGKSDFHVSGDCSVGRYTRQIEELLQVLDWHQFDIAGYSFGGMVAARLCDSGVAAGLCYLLEPAMLFSADVSQIRRKAEEYLSVAERVRADINDEQAYFAFLDSVSPARLKNEKTDRLTVNRLKSNAAGFACALTAVAQTLLAERDQFSQLILPWPGMSFVGGLSAESMQHRHQQLAEQCTDWEYILVPDADHSLVFTKPRFIARAMNGRKQRADS